MAFTLFVPEKIERAIDKLKSAERMKVRNALRAISVDPFSGKPLRGKREGQYSVRAWPYRIIYKIYRQELLILVIEFGHRQGVYND